MDDISQLEQQLAQLERDWERQREGFLVMGKDGKLSEPTGANLVPRVIVMIGSVVMMAFLSATSLSGFLAYVLLVPFSIATFQLLSGAGKSDAFERAQSVYESHRSAIYRKIEAAQRAM